MSNKCNTLRRGITIEKLIFGNSINFMNFFIYKGADVFKTGKLDNFKNFFIYKGTVFAFRSGHGKHVTKTT